MEKEFVPYELAIKLEELGFDESCCGFYDHMIKEIDTISADACERLCKHYTHIKAPTWQSAFRWFRENHFYISYVCAPYKEHDEFYFRIRHIGNVLNEGQLESCESRMYNTYEEAELVCLTKLIEIVEQKEKV